MREQLPTVSPAASAKERVRSRFPLSGGWRNAQKFLADSHLAVLDEIVYIKIVYINISEYRIPEYSDIKKAEDDNYEAIN